ncbi:hypothetical protein DEM27_10420 [Metarhizobium album]|uniref:Uncharacterized protein n=1 Tax=Metarhizobium album TaxID=2182425 RepID=A0A2U2DTY0_9HYPH|nr:hypothetical protein [Rhizobium album]PWE56768.1 hypothetical protein DEM27_10420 [Rhizobium album]
MKTITIATATPAQLASFATINLGLEVNYRMGSPAIIAKMRAAGFADDTIDVDDEIPVAATPVGLQTEHRETVTVIIAQQDEPGGSDPVFLGVNGVAMVVHRGVASPISRPYFEALKNAVKTVYNINPDGSLGDAREVPQYPFSVIAA